MKNNERGGFQVAGIVILGVLAVVALYLMFKYQNDMRKYARGPRHNVRVAVAKKPIKKIRPLVPAVRPAPSFMIQGGLKNRPIVHKEIPPYPAWAEREGVFGRVQLVFRVSQAGEVYPTIRVAQTMGHPDFDEAAVKALKKWRFAPVPDSVQTGPASLADEPTPGEMGTIDFNYVLSYRPLES
jgi:TonB family protein